MAYSKRIARLLPQLRPQVGDRRIRILYNGFGRRMGIHPQIIAAHESGSPGSRARRVWSAAASR